MKGMNYFQLASVIIVLHAHPFLYNYYDYTVTYLPDLCIGKYTFTMCIAFHTNNIIKILWYRNSMHASKGFE